jgi:hypothetical protein
MVQYSKHRRLVIRDSLVLFRLVGLLLEAFKKLADADYRHAVMQITNTQFLPLQPKTCKQNKDKKTNYTHHSHNRIWTLVFDRDTGVIILFPSPHTI